MDNECIIGTEVENHGGWGGQQEQRPIYLQGDWWEINMEK